MARKQIYTGHGQKYGDSNTDVAAIVLWAVNIALACGSTQINANFQKTNDTITASCQEAEQELEDLEARIAETDAAIADLQAQIAELER